MATIFPSLNNKLLSFLTEWKQIHDFGVHHRVFSYARHIGIAKKNKRCIVDKIQDVRHFFKLKQ